MALPFILGLAVGAGAIIAFNNKDKLKNKTAGLLDKSKDFAEELKGSICPMKKSSEEKVELKNKEEE